MQNKTYYLNLIFNYLIVKRLHKLLHTIKVLDLDF